MAERNFLYPIALKKESTKGTAVTPDVYVPCYDGNLATMLNLISDEPAYGSRFMRFQSLQGLRSHTGSLTVMAEPNSLGYFMDMTVSRTATSGSDPYTHTFKPSLSSEPNSYTIDISYTSYAVRWYGVEAGKMTFTPDGDKMVLKLDLSALGSFYPREISAQPTGSGPYTVVLKTDYDPEPTKGLVASDNIKLYDASAGTYITATVASIVDGTSFTTATDVTTLDAGDQVMLAPFTPSLSLLTPFLWGRTQFFLSDTAANAQTASSTASNQTRFEPGTEVSIMYPFANNDGEKRSGGFDPASLVRERYDVEFKPKVFLDTPDKIKEWAAISKKACVMRSYSGTNKEFRITMNNLRARTNDTPVEAGKVIYHEFDYALNEDTSDGQAFDGKVTNSVSSI